MQDRHGVSYTDYELQSHRVSAAPYLKAAAGTRLSCSDTSALPKLSDAIENVYNPHTSTAYSNGIRTSSPASYAYGANSGVTLRDPYSKPALDLYPNMYSQEMFNAVEYSRYSPEVTGAGFWIQPSYGVPTETAYYNGQIVPAPTMSYMGTPAMVVSPPTGAVQPNVTYGVYPQNSGTISAGSLSPHSSRSSSSSPVSSLASLHSHNKPPAPAPSYPNFLQSPGQY